MEQLIRWYFDKMKREEILCGECSSDKILVDDSLYKNMVDDYFDMLEYSNISSDNHTITFDTCGTNLINELFKKYVNDDTLVISTSYEHNSVQEILNSIDNKIILNTDDLKKHNISSIMNYNKPFKNAFVYIIGTQISTGEITPQDFFVKIKDYFLNNNIEHTIVIDDVHGMFFIPRDYSLFDYVLYTAHAILPDYNMGMLISKHGDIGEKIYNWGNDYLKKLYKIKEKIYYYRWFRNILLDYFYEFISSGECIPYNQTVDHIFAMETNGLMFTEKNYNKLKEYGITISEHKNYKNFIRIRFQEFIEQDVDIAIEGLKFTKKLLNQLIMMKYMQ